MARSPSKNRAAVRRQGAITPPETGHPHPDPLTTEKAEEMLGGEPSPLDAANIPADAAASTTETPGDSIKIGNRTFGAAPTKLGGRTLDILPDLPDVRDRIYHPRLRALSPSIYPRIAFKVRDQGAASSCTGHALAHVIDGLLHRENLLTTPKRVSARMLYEMAKRNDEWNGTTYFGSSVRGAVKGFFRNGICSEALAPDGTEGEWTLTYEMAKEARETRLGAYYRLQPDLSDYHAALEEIGAIYASAQIHTNWQNPGAWPTQAGGSSIERQIKPGGAPAGGHAFVIVGYDAEGFWVLNSWGPQWGRNGMAHWLYEDWAATMMDGWVLQLGVRAPTAFSALPRAVPAGATTPYVATGPNRGDIVGHFINIDDGRYITSGRYASPNELEMKETVKRLVDPNSNKDPGDENGKGYDHLVIYAHGGLNTLDDEAHRIATWKRNDIFARNKIYNFHLMWGSGFVDEAFGRLSQTETGRAGGFLGDLLFETIGKPFGSAAWRNMKQDASAAFTPDSEYDGGFLGLSLLLKGLDKAERRPKLHLVGHSAGAIMLGQFLGALKRFKLTNMQLGSIHLMAPACTVAFFTKFYGKYLTGDGALPLEDKIYLYNLSGQLELEDKVGIGSLPGYGRSLLYLVSRAYENEANTALAGMELFAKKMPKSERLSVSYSRSDDTKSTSHGGFDNDASTLTTIMSRVLDGKVPRPPTANELTGY
ncbi:C1 family peptidase [Mesorhizobium sp.]|uniref:C1 family peptidase n=1 Tax=Mesorhizobium sp. TaxID=1871066 RepID=UPI00257C4CE2|nr:C1 family peptidase [Mesorhizobium sp.]